MCGLVAQLWLTLSPVWAPTSMLPCHKFLDIKSVYVPIQIWYPRICDLARDNFLIAFQLNTKFNWKSPDPFSACWWCNPSSAVEQRSWPARLSSWVFEQLFADSAISCNEVRKVKASMDYVLKVNLERNVKAEIQALTLIFTLRSNVPTCVALWLSCG